MAISLCIEWWLDSHDLVLLWWWLDSHGLVPVCGGGWIKAMV